MCVRERVSPGAFSVVVEHVVSSAQTRCVQQPVPPLSAQVFAPRHQVSCGHYAQGINLLGGGFTLFENAVLARSVRKDPNPRFCKIPFTVDALACALGIRLVHFELFPAGFTGLLPAFSLLVTHLGGFDGNSSQVILKQVNNLEVDRSTLGRHLLNK